MSLSFEEVYDATLSVLTADVDGGKERILQEIVQWELQNPPKVEEYSNIWGFEWYHVHSDPRTLASMVSRRILNIVYKSSSSTVFRLVSRDAVQKALDNYKGSLTPVEEALTIPPDLFAIVIGHESKKELIKRGLESPKPVHFLLWGTPASAKTLMLEELSRLPRSHFILGSSLTKAGLFEMLFTQRPTYLILDELDKIDDSTNLGALLSLMERGIVTETKYRRHKHINLTTWVFASANDPTKIPRELMSRFLKLKFSDYTNDEYMDVVVTVLREREQLGQSLSLYISQKVLRDLDSKDVRDAIRIARLLKNRDKQEVDHIIDILKHQK